MNLSTSIFDKHTRVNADEKIAIKHVQTGGPTIYVSTRRVKRILKRRKKRVEFFLMKNPEYLLPYKFRSHGPIHKSRSKSAKNRKRTRDGKFAKVADRPVDFSIDINDPEIYNDGPVEDVVVRDSI